LKKKSCQRTGPRVPLEFKGIQVNFCKNPLCANYGVAVSTKRKARGPGAKLKNTDKYTLNSNLQGKVVKFKCSICGEKPPAKSNQAISEELERIGSNLQTSIKPSCPNTSCTNHCVEISVGKTAYQSFGKTKSGSHRYRCKACSKTFSVKGPTTGQKQPHKNKIVFKLLMNKSPFKRICEVADISMSTVYNKIDFFHKQCLGFVADRERKLLQGKHLDRVYVSVDRQEYVVNWSRRADKRNIKLSAIGSADNKTGYVFGMHLNYDAAVCSKEVESEALVCGDNQKPRAFREFSRLWLDIDYQDSLLGSIARKKIEHGLSGDIQSSYEKAMIREDIEVSEKIDSSQMLPEQGMQVHSDYTMYGHFFYLHKLFGGVDKVRFLLDQDSGMRAACLSAFQKEVSTRTCDAFYVRLNKDLTVDEKRRVLSDSRKMFKAAQGNFPKLKENEVKLTLIKQRMAEMVELGHWKDKWLLHPFPNMSEPEKAICYLTDYGDYDEDHQAWLYNKASMHGIDCFFMQVRRRLSLLERPIASSSAARRMWYGYSAYKPAVIVKLLDIFRVYYNYCLAGKDKETPAMRIGLAKGIVPLEDIIYH